MNDKSTYHHSVVDYARKDYNALNKNLSVDETLNKIRLEGVGERIVYFYVVDDEQRLVGVLPTRRLLIGKLEQKLEDIMVKRVAALPGTSTVYDALEFFATYKFLAFPVVDAERRMIGVVDVNLFTDELLEEKDSEAASEVEPQDYDSIFETIGFKISEVKNASPVKAWRVRLPWLFATVTSGTICALLTGMFETTLAESLIVVFFFTLVLGLGESVSIQSMTVTIQALRTAKPSFKWFVKNFLREAQTALMLGLSCATVVTAVVVVWKGDVAAAGVIGLSVVLIQLIASVWGLSVPAILHRAKLDPKIAAGPITLALTDICTILFYFGLAALVL
ncbi:MAG: magnesium transporter [Stygiobacter sp.]|nr:MAG: magnesium transporter [Stygiobacter sp.]